MRNQVILNRLDQLIVEGEQQWAVFKKAASGKIDDTISWAKWTTSSLNLLDKLSISTNRFVREFEIWVHPDTKHDVNIGAALGVLKSAREEYALGLAVEYHLSVSAAVFEGILDEATYLQEKGYLRAAAVLLGAALEEGLKNRAKAIPIEIDPKDTLVPVIVKLKACGVEVLTEFDAKRLESIARMRNDAAHGGDFKYEGHTVSEALETVRAILDRILRQ
jgi:hypothetical protein